MDQNWLFHKLHWFCCAIFSRILPWWANKFFRGQVSIKGTLHVFVEPRHTFWICRAQSIPVALRGPFSRRIALLGFLSTSPKKRRKKRTLSVSCGTIIWTTSWTDFPPKVEHHMSIAGIWETQVVDALLDGNRVIFHCHVNAYPSLVETTTNKEFCYFGSFYATLLP